jgi:hypothetical protein
VHTAALARLGGVPAVVRVDNTKTAMVRGAGPWGVVNPIYATYARALGFHVDAARPYCPGDKGKVERRIRHRRSGLDPYAQDWASVEAFQSHTDAYLEDEARRRLSPATGETIETSWREEQRLLAPLPALMPEPFDQVVQRRVAIDATLRFEGRTYSVPFAWVDRVIEVRGCARSVQCYGDGRLVAEHPRHTRSRVVLDPLHYEGESTEQVEAPVPLGKMGRKLQELWALAPERRPIDLYAALAEVAR